MNSQSPDSSFSYDSDSVSDEAPETLQKEPEGGSADFETRAKFYREQSKQAEKNFAKTTKSQKELITPQPSDIEHANSPTPPNSSLKKGQARRFTVQFDEKAANTLLKKINPSQKQSQELVQKQLGLKDRGQSFKQLHRRPLVDYQNEEFSDHVKGEITGQRKAPGSTRTARTTLSTKVLRIFNQNVSPNFISPEEKLIRIKTFESQFRKNNPELQVLLQAQAQKDSRFASYWSKLVLVIHTYNFYTCFWFLGFPGWPQNIWLAFEVVFEIIIVVDFALRWAIRTRFPDKWENMQLLHDDRGKSKVQFVLNLLRSIPTSVIMTIVLQNNVAILSHFGIACLRLLKLIHLHQVGQYFEAIELEKKRSSKVSWFAAFEVFYTFSLIIHFISSCWQITGRLDPNRTNMHVLLLYTKFQNTANAASDFQKWVDATFFISGTMSGMGYGNCFPTTNSEWFVDCFIMLFGTTIYANFFAKFMTATKFNKRKAIENEERHKNARQFSAIKNLGEDTTVKIRYFYNKLRLSFLEFSQKHSILKELPVSMQGELSIQFNTTLIQNVRFFQLAEPSFIVQMSRSFEPYLCISGERIVHVGEIAGRMYFIHTGYVEILASDNKTTIAFQHRGQYFGEIGILITGKRTCNVRSCDTTILYTVSNAVFKGILEQYPKMLNYLQAVGAQRLQTTTPADVMRSTHSKERIEVEIDKTQESNSDIFATAKSNLGLFNEMTFKANNEALRRMTSMQVKTQSIEAEKPSLSKKPWLTETFRGLDQFLIIPFSRLFNVWHVFLLMAVWYNIIIVPYSIGGDVNLNVNWFFYLIDWIAILIHVVDIWFRANTALTSHREICLNKGKILSFYIENFLLTDVLATIPFEYMLLAFKVEDVWRRWVRILRLLKLIRVNEIVQITKFHANINLDLFMIFRLFVFYPTAAHVFACVYVYICNREVYQDRRFDGNQMYENINVRNFMDLPPIAEMDHFSRYVQCFYVTSGQMGAIIYGDTVPYTYSEQFWTLFVMMCARLYLAYLYANVANYLCSLQLNLQTHTQKISLVRRWLQINAFADPLIERVVDYHKLMFEDFKGIDQEAILKDLPEALSREIRIQMLTPLIANWKAFPKENQGVLQTVIRRLKLSIFPAGEFVVRFNEVGNEMFFINKGVVRVTSVDGVEFATMRTGDNFGEMALLDTNKPIRGANIVTVTKVWLAVLTLQDFKVICEIYPEFNDTIFNIVQERKRINFEREKRLMTEEPSLHTVKEEVSVQTSSSSDSSTSQPSLKKKKQSLNKQKNNRAGGDAGGSNGEVLSQSVQISVEDVEHEEFKSQSVRDDLGKKRRSSKSERIPRHLAKQLKVEEPERIDTERTLIDDKASKLHQTYTQPNPTGEVKLFVTMQQVSSAVSSKKKSNEAIRNRRSTVFVAKIQDHFQNDREFVASVEQRRTGMQVSCKRLFHFCILLLSSYNVIFIPLQFAFRIEFDSEFLALEIITIFFYLADAILRLMEVQLLQKIKTNSIPDERLTKEQQKLKVDHEKLDSRIRMCKFELAASIIAAVPVSAIIDFVKWHDPWYVKAFLCSTRLIKSRPILNGFAQLKKRSMSFWRVIEVIAYYYIVCTWFSCLMISMALWVPDVRTTWLRRVPSPQWNGFRSDPDIWSDTTAGSIYLHALFYVGNTLSHVAVGDITAVTVTEKFLNCFLCWIGTFCYNFLYGNIVAFVAGFAPGSHLAFHRRYNQVQRKLKNEHIPESLVQHVDQYFDYEWAASQGFEEDVLLKELPTSIQSDIMLSRYQDMIEGCLLFREKDGRIDIAMTNSIFRLMKVEVFMHNEFLLKIGQKSESSFIILEGKVNLIGLCENENLGVLYPGSFYGNSLSSEPKSQPNDVKNHYFIGANSPFKLEPGDNLDGRASVHLVAYNFVKIGVINSEDLQVLFKAYPDWKVKFQTLNRYLFDLGVTSLEKFVKSKGREPTHFGLLDVVSNHYMYSHDDEYEKVIEQLELDSQKSVDLTQALKQHYIDITPISSHSRIALQSSCMVPNAPPKKRMRCGPDALCSKGLQFEPTSKQRHILESIQLANLLYIALAEPIYCGFLVPVTGIVMMLEVFSLAISLIVIFLKFRTPVLVKGDLVFNCGLVARHYWHNGMLIDFCGIIPANIILETIPWSSVSSRTLKGFIFAVRLVRLISCWHGIKIFATFEIYLKKFHVYVQITKAILSTFLLLHWLSCAWGFLMLALQFDVIGDTWFSVNKLEDKNSWERYLRSIYMVINVVATIGYGDMYPCTTLERAFYMALCTSGDVLFALTFGLLASLSLQRAADDEIQMFIEKMCETQQLLDAYNVPKSQKKRVEEYFAFAFYLENHSKILNRQDLDGKISSSLVNSIIYYSSKGHLKPLFADFGSENLLKEISYHLTNVIYLPQDFIIEKGTVGEEMYFLVEGLVMIIAGDKQTVLTTLNKGSYFGEIAILFKSKRTSYVQAESYCVVSVLKKDHLDEVLKSFPQIEKAFRIKAQERLSELDKMSNAQSVDAVTNRTNISEFGRALQQNDESGDSFFYKAGAHSEFEDVKNSGILHERQTQALAARTEHHRIAIPKNLMRLTSVGNLSEEFSSRIRGDSDQLKLTQVQEATTAKRRQTRKPRRRLSQVSLGKNLMLSQTTGLKLQWTVGNQ